MRTLTGLATIAALIGLCWPQPVQAQIGEAGSAFRAVVSEAQRLFRNRRSARRNRFRSMVAADGSIIIPPRPTRNPRRLAPKTRPNGSAQRTARTNATQNPAGKGSTNADAGKPAFEQPVAKPDVWTTAEIELATRSCRRVLGTVSADLQPVAPIKKGACGTAAPFRLASLSGHQRVTFHPAPVLNCKMVAALDRWLRRGLQPLAKKHLGSPIVRVTVMSSYSCRNAYGRALTRLSKHALANAIDIRGFLTANGENTNLLAHWGPTKRDLIAQAEQERARKQAQQRRLNEQQPVKEKASPSQAHRSVSGVTPPPAPKPPKTVVRSDDGTNSLPALTTRAPAQAQDKRSRAAASPIAASTEQNEDLLPPIPMRRPSLRERLQWAKAAATKLAEQRARKSREAYRERLNKFLLTPRSNLGGPKSQPTAKSRSERKVDRAAFLREAHRMACRVFGTVLGPEANDSHRDHFHVDLADRRSGNFCR